MLLCVAAVIKTTRHRCSISRPIEADCQVVTALSLLAEIRLRDRCQGHVNKKIK